MNVKDNKVAFLFALLFSSCLSTILLKGSSVKYAH